MPYSFTVTELAKEEIINGYLWYESQKFGLGEEYFDEIDKVYKLIKENPRYFQVKRKKKYFEAVVERFPYVIIYTFDEREIRILSVFNTHRNPKKKPS